MRHHDVRSRIPPACHTDAVEMKWCPECGGEFRSFLTECPDCGVALVDEPPFLDAPATESFEPRSLERTADGLRLMGTFAMVIGGIGVVAWAVLTFTALTRFGSPAFSSLGSDYTIIAAVSQVLVLLIATITIAVGVALRAGAMLLRGRVVLVPDRLQPVGATRPESVPRPRPQPSQLQNVPRRPVPGTSTQPVPQPPAERR